MLLRAENVVLQAVIASLRRRRFNYQNEKDLQAGVESVLSADGFEFVRERALPDAGIIDFLVYGFLGIEIKIKGSPSEVARQLLRYARCEEVKGLVLVTGRSALSTLPSEMLGKPLHVVELWRTFL
jgi:hypothetical protein